MVLCNQVAHSEDPVEAWNLHLEVVLFWEAQVVHGDQTHVALLLGPVSLEETFLVQEGDLDPYHLDASGPKNLVVLLDQDDHDQDDHVQEDLACPIHHDYGNQLPLPYIHILDREEVPQDVATIPSLGDPLHLVDLDAPCDLLALEAFSDRDLGVDVWDPLEEGL